jgi:hypothetical protein
MGKEVEFTFEFDGPIPGKMILSDEVLPPPTEPPPTEPPPVPAEDYHWYNTGEDISILTGDKKLNDKLVESQMVYRSGQFWGFVLLNASSPTSGEPIRVYPRGGHIPFKFEGLANAGKTFGNGSYSNKSQADGRYCQVRWIREEPHGLGLEFSVQDPMNSDKWSRIKKGFPTTWETYGLFLSWNIGVP